MSRLGTESSARLEPVDMQRLRHLLGGALALIGAAGLPLVDNFDPLWAGGALLAILAALALPRVFAGRGSRFWARAGLVVFAYAALDLILSGMAGRQNLLGAVIRVTLLLAVLRTMQPRRRREDMQLILLSMFLTAVGGALSLSPVFAVQVFVFIPVSGGVLFLVNRFEDTAGVVPPDPHWSGYRAREFISHVRGACDWRFGAFLAGCLGVVLLCAALIFQLLPRFRMDRAVPFLELPGSGRTGVSEGMSLGGVAELTQDETPAMRVDTPDRARPVLSPYWRMNVLDRYRSGVDECGFAMSSGSGAESTYEMFGRGAVWSAGVATPVRHEARFQRGEWVVHLEPNVSRLIPAVGAVARVRFDKSQEWRESAALRSLRLDRVSAASLHMQMEVRGDLAAHMPPPVELRRLRELREPAEFRYPGTLLSLPADAASRGALASAVATVTGGERLDAAEFSRRTSAWLASRHAYALRDGYAVRVPPPGEPKDYLVRWMRSDATGWCEHFAGSLVLLAREAGYPARLISGFSGGEWNESDGYLVVRMKHAHAWCEIFDRESGYWLRADPTPASGGLTTGGEADADRRRIGSFSGLAAWYDGVTMLWFRKVVNFEESDQREAVRKLGETVSSWRAGADALMKSARASLLAAWERWREAPRDALPAVAITAVAVTIVILARRRLLRLRLSRVREADASDRVVLAYRRKAGLLLPKLDKAAARGRAIPPPVRAAVEQVRYGRPSEWGDPEAVLAAAHRALRG